MSFVFCFTGGVCDTGFHAILIHLSNEDIKHEAQGQKHDFVIYIYKAAHLSSE